MSSIYGRPSRMPPVGRMSTESKVGFSETCVFRVPVRRFEGAVGGPDFSLKDGEERWWPLVMVALLRRMKQHSPNNRATSINTGMTMAAMTPLLRPFVLYIGSLDAVEPAASAEVL